MSPWKKAAGAASAALLSGVAIAGLGMPASGSDPVVSTASVPNISIAASFSDTLVMPGDTVTIDYAVALAGSNTSTNYTATGLSGILTFVGCSTPVGTCGPVDGGDAFRFRGIFPGGTTSQVSATFTVDANATAGSYPLEQSFFTSSFDSPDFSPPVVLTIPAQEADVAVSLDATAGPLLTSQITYDLDVTNAGPGGVDSTTVLVDLPTQVTAVSGLGPECVYSPATDEVTCSTGAVALGDTFSDTFQANLGLLSLGSLPATATLTSSAPTDPDPSNDTSTANCSVLTSLLVSCN